MSKTRRRLQKVERIEHRTLCDYVYIIKILSYTGYVARQEISEEKIEGLSWNSSSGRGRIYTHAKEREE